MKVSEKLKLANIYLLIQGYTTIIWCMLKQLFKYSNVYAALCCILLLISCKTYSNIKNWKEEVEYNIDSSIEESRRLCNLDLTWQRDFFVETIYRINQVEELKKFKNHLKRLESLQKNDTLISIHRYFIGYDTDVTPKPIYLKKNNKKINIFYYCEGIFHDIKLSQFESLELLDKYLTLSNGCDFTLVVVTKFNTNNRIISINVFVGRYI